MGKFLAAIRPNSSENILLKSKFLRQNLDSRVLLCLMLSGIPLASVLLASICFLIGIPVGGWQGILPITAGCWMLWRRRETCRDTLPAYILVLIASIVVSGLFLFCDSYDSSICHRPAVVLIGKGWNPIWQPAIPLMQEKLGWDFAGISLKHIVYQPKAVWIYGAIMYRMTGIATGDLGLFPLFFTALYLTTYLLASHSWPSSAKWHRHLLCLTVIAMPKLTQALSGQVDNVLYAMTLIMAFSLFLFVQGYGRNYLILSLVNMLWLTTTKISGIPIALVVFTTMSVWHLYKTPAANRWKKIRKMFMIFFGCLAIFLTIDASPYITSSIYYGGPFYPAHSFVKEHQMKNADLTNDFVGNEDAESMGYVGRVVYAYFSTSLVSAYYRHKLHKNEFSPRFRVAEGCDGFKTIFRFVMILGCLAWICSRRTPVDILIASLFISAVFLPTKYIGYARYATQIWCVPFLMLFNFGFASRSIFPNKTAKGFVLAVCSIYAILVLGRQTLVTAYMFHHSEQCMNELQKLDKDWDVYLATSSPGPKWSADGNFIRFSHQGPALPYAVIIHELLGKDKAKGVAFHRHDSEMPLPFSPRRSLFLIQHGRFMFSGKEKEFQTVTAVQEPTSPVSAKTFPYGRTLLGLPSYLLWNAKTRLYGFANTVFSGEFNEHIKLLN